MSKQIINIGRTANDRSGDPLRVAFDKVNQNFTELYSAMGTDVQIPIQTGNEGKFLRTDGTQLSWVSIITSTSQLVNGSNTVSLDGTGSLVLPNSGTIDNSIEFTPAVGTIYTFINDGTDVPGIDNTNVLYLDNTINAQTIQAGWIITFANATQKTVTVADVGMPPNASKRMLTFVGSISLTSSDVWPLTVQSADYSSGVNITKLEITPEGTTTWSFDSNGVIKLPVSGDIVDSTGATVLGAPTLIDGGNASTPF